VLGHTRVVVPLVSSAVRHIRTDRLDAALGGVIPESQLRALVAYIKTLKTG
jgi:hypothetical protein